MPADDLQRQYVHLLMRYLSTGRYPSLGFLDRVEKALPDRQTAEEYGQLLLHLISQDQYPSPRMLDRAARLASALAG